MKRFLATFLMMAILMIAVPLASNAQTRYGPRYSAQNYERPNIYQRHRNVINIGAGTGAGALLGALAGGKKGAALGALIGAGASTLYTYKIKPKQRRY